MILIVALNMSIHKTAIVDGLDIGTINVIQDQRMVVGDCAVYSSLIIKTLQGEPYVLGIAGGIGGRYIKNFMDKNRIKSDLLWKEAEIKSELKIIDSIHMTETTFIDDTFIYDEGDAKNLRHKILNNVKDIETLIVNDQGKCGEFSSQIIEDTIKLGHDYQMKVIASLSGDQLRRALELRPYAAVILNTDLDELGISASSEEIDMSERLRRLGKEKGMKFLIYDDGQRLYTVSKNKVCIAKYGKFSKDFDNLAIKDILIGALATCISRNYPVEKMTKIMAATRSAINPELYPKICSRKDIDDLYGKIKIVEQNFIG